jgi:hypothetical protein
MAYFAQLDQDNNVMQVVAITNADIDYLPFPESDPVGVALCQNLFGADTVWKQTSYNNNFRRKYASIGGFYYPPLDVFVDPRPYPSWSFQSSDATWQAPIPMPSVPANYFAIWNEQYLEWDIVLGSAI